MCSLTPAVFIPTEAWGPWATQDSCLLKCPAQSKRTELGLLLRGLEPSWEDRMVLACSLAGGLLSDSIEWDGGFH